MHTKVCNWPGKADTQTPPLWGTVMPQELLEAPGHPRDTPRVTSSQSPAPFPRWCRPASTIREGHGLGIPRERNAGP